MGELRLSRDQADLNVIGWVVSRLLDFMQRNWYADANECETLSGQIVGMVCRELTSLGLRVPSMLAPLPHVRTAEEFGRTIFVVRAGPNHPAQSVRLLVR